MPPTNPFASFYESRRQISLEMGDDETADPSSSITRAYIVPEALLALARGQHEKKASARMTATYPADDPTESTRMFRFRSPPMVGIAAEWRTLQAIAWQVAGWLRRAWRRSIPD
jgi:hypothetical protein